MRRPTATLTACALLLTGCAAGTDEPADEPADAPTGGDAATGTPPADGPGSTPTAAPSPTTTSAPSPTATPSTAPTPGPTAGDPVELVPCTSAVFRISSPADWSTNEPGAPLPACRVFDPGPVDLPDEPRGIGLHWAVVVLVDEVPFEDATSDPAGELLERTTGTVDGRDAVATEVLGDGVALLPEGERQYGWSVDLDGRTLTAFTTTVGPTDYQRDRRVLDRMMSTLQVAEVEPLAGPASTDPRTGEASGDGMALTDVEVTRFTTFERLTLSVAGSGEAGWDVAYVSTPRAAGSGRPLDLAGTAALRVTLTGMALPPDAPAPVYDGPERIEPPTDAIREVLDDTVVGGTHQLFVGLDRERPFRIGRVDGDVVVEVPLG